MRPYIPLVDDSLVIQAAATKTADFNGDWLDLGAGFQAQALGQLMAAVVPVTALDLADTNETYTLKIQQAPADASGVADTANITDAGPVTPVTATGIAVVKAIIAERFIQLVLDVGGTTPSITYSGKMGR